MVLVRVVRVIILVILRMFIVWHLILHVTNVVWVLFEPRWIELLVIDCQDDDVITMHIGFSGIVLGGVGIIGQIHAPRTGNIKVAIRRSTKTVLQNASEMSPVSGVIQRAGPYGYLMFKRKICAMPRNGPAAHASEPRVAAPALWQRVDIWLHYGILFSNQRMMASADFNHMNQ